MKIVAFTDSHGSNQALNKVTILAQRHKADAIVCCGDFTVFSQDAKQILEKMSKIGIPIIVIPGNHEDEIRVKRYAERMKNIYYVDRQTFQLDGTIFLGYGGGGFAHREKEFIRAGQLFRKKIMEAKKKISDLKVVLVTHAPPYGTALDKIMRESCGNKDITDFIKDAKPDLALCGHLHENEGKEDKIGRTKIANPGPFGKLFII